MIAVRAFAHKTVAVFGLARTGLGAIRALVAGGTQVIAWDDNSAARDLGGQEGAEIVPWREWPWEKIAALVLSPGVPLTHPQPHGVVEHATRARVPVIGDVELFAREIRVNPELPGKAPVIAITGTNGKSTTTALVGHILKECGFDTQIGGNIGKSVLELASPSPKTIYVLEMSSFQIDLAPGLTPDVGLLSNLSPDHIDRHGTMENYAAIKARLMKQTAKDGQVVIGVDDGYSSAIFTQLSGARGAQAHPVSVGKVLGRGIFVVDGALYDALGIGWSYLESEGRSTFTLSMNVDYLREVFAGEQVIVQSRLLDCDGKRVHYFHEMRRSDGHVAATNELLAMHVNMTTRRSEPFPEDIQKRLAWMKNAHAAMPLPSQVGRKLGIRRRSSNSDE